MTEIYIVASGARMGPRFSKFFKDEMNARSFYNKRVTDLGGIFDNIFAILAKLYIRDIPDTGFMWCMDSIEDGPCEILEKWEVQLRKKMNLAFRGAFERVGLPELYSLCNVYTDGGGPSDDEMMDSDDEENIVLGSFNCECFMGYVYEALEGLTEDRTVHYMTNALEERDGGDEDWERLRITPDNIEEVFDIDREEYPIWEESISDTLVELICKNIRETLDELGILVGSKVSYEHRGGGMIEFVVDI
jgi:hypothetical protein